MTHHLAALGSSFAAGPGIAPVADRAAMRSMRNYPHLLADRLGARLTDLTVSGATTATILHTPQRRLLHRFPPQVFGVPADADLVTITAGGNDLRYIGTMTAAAWSNRLRSHPLTRLLGDLAARRASADVSKGEVARAVDGLVAVVGGVRKRAPGAAVMLVDYLTVLGPQSTPGRELGLTQSQIDQLQSVGVRLNEVFAEAARRTGAQLVAVSTASVDHAMGSVDPWVSGFRSRRGEGTAFHPNRAGMAAVADVIAGALNG